MSTEYYLICERHKEQAHVCSDGLSGPLSQNRPAYAAFIITHRKCDLKVIDEHNEEYDHFSEWDADNWNSRLRYDLE